MTLEGKIMHGMSLSTECVSDVMVIAFGPIGSFVDLSGYYTKKEIDDKGYLTEHQDISGKADSADLASVATSGSYNDLSNKPTIPTVPTNVSAFTNDVGYLTQHQSLADYYTKTEVDTVLGGKVDSADLASVATSGSYNDLSNKPSIPAAQVQSDWSQSDSSKVDYIKNKPTIPAAQVQADWNESDNSSKAYILNKPTVPDLSTYCPIIEDTRSSAVAAITGVAPFDTLVDGQRIVVKLKYKTSANATLTLTGLTNALPIYARCNTNNNSDITPIYVNGFVASSYMELIYDATNSRWICTNYDRVMTYEALTQSRIDSSSTAQCVITGKLLRDNFYLKSEINSMIGDIETLLANI